MSALRLSLPMLLVKLPVAPLLFEVGVRDSPLLDFEGDPDGVDTKGDEREQPPFDPHAKELVALAVEAQALPAYDGVLDAPTVLGAGHPRVCEAERDEVHRSGPNKQPDVAEEPCIKP